MVNANYETFTGPTKNELLNSFDTGEPILIELDSGESIFVKISHLSKYKTSNLLGFGGYKKNRFSGLVCSLYCSKTRRGRAEIVGFIEMLKLGSYL